MRQEISRGAEAVIYREGDVVIKERPVKPYRLPILDTQFRKQRTRREAKVIGDLPIPGPKLISSDEKTMTITMEYVDGEKLRNVLEQKDYIALSQQLGKSIRAMHDKHIMHGDLTTSNMILRDGKIHLIDFGLSFHSEKIEDRAVDLQLLKHALESTHYTIAKECFEEVLKAYNYKDVIERLKEVEKRGRYKMKKGS